MTVFCDAVPCRMIEIERSFRGACYCHHQCNMMMESVSASETSDNSYQSTYNIPEDNNLHTRSCENIKSQQCQLSWRIIILK